jgi:outer membrane receptor protein involved in Fe transport
MKRLTIVCAGALLAALGTTGAWAQTEQTEQTEQTIPAAGQEPSTVDEVFVTGTAKPERRITTSISISSVDAQQIERLAPLGAADLLRNVPGIRAEASGGEGNANIAVRGLPVASGGGKFVQFQEDGLPVLNFGDVAFATADIFVRPDYNVGRLEVVRGGSASTFTSNAPGAIFNYISKTGTVKGGSLGFTQGVDFDRSRLDFDYGSPIGDDWRFHVGGFYRYGEGVKDVGYKAENGGQIKANVTRELDNGYLRLNFKFLDDRAPVYVPGPIKVSGTESDPTYSSFAGFDVLSGTLQSPYFRSDLAINHNGERITTDVADGYRTQSRAIGGEASFDLGGGWTLEDRFNVAKNYGSFTANYPARVATAATFLSELGGSGATLRYATGPKAGQTITDPSTLNGNGLASNTLLFNVTLDDFTNATNVLTLSKDYDAGRRGSGSITFGYFKSYQAIEMDWHWNSYLQEVNGNKSALLDVYNAAGQAITQNGLIAYGEPVFGNCCIRYYNVDYDIDAPYVSASWKIGNLSLDGGLRYNISSASGYYAANSGTSVIDVNQDGVIQVPEQTVPVVNMQAQKPVDYEEKYLTWSLGANYALTPDLALFGRVSRGARFNADRVLFGGGVRDDGSIAEQVAVNFVEQQEGGVKFRTDLFFVNATAFHATTSESNELVIPVQAFIDNDYVSYGVELEGGINYGIFHLTGGVTYTDAKIDRSGANSAQTGNVPYRQADWIFQATPSISTGPFEIGANFVGSSDSYASDANQLVMPGYVVTNLFGSYALTPSLKASISVQNLFDVIAITEVGQNTSTVGDGINTARTIPGRNISVGLRYNF